MALTSANTFKFIFNFNFLREKSVISDIISCFPMLKYISAIPLFFKVFIFVIFVSKILFIEIFFGILVAIEISLLNNFII